MWVAGALAAASSQAVHRWPPEMQMGSHMGFQPGLVASRVSGMWCQDVCQGVARLCTQLQAGRPHIGPTGQWPLGVPAALGGAPIGQW